MNTHTIKTASRIMSVWCFVLFIGFRTTATHAQEGSDVLYEKARQVAFEKKQYKNAITLMEEAIRQTPDYKELKVFLGKLYTWDHQEEKARATFDPLLRTDPADEELVLAYGNLEFWNQHYDRAMHIVRTGLRENPTSEDLLLLRGKILRGQKNYQEATRAFETLLEVNPSHSEGRYLLQQSRILADRNEIGLNYNYIYFDNRFENAWHIGGIDYTRRGSFGAFTARINYANRFTKDALQADMEAYPRISDVFYGYVNFGISGKNSVFPHVKTGASLFANLPAAFELEGGFRFLSFTDNESWTYTASVGKYYENFWFNFRTYITPDNSNIAHSYQLTTRYYMKGVDNYINVRLGTGISPDSRSGSILYDDIYNFKQESYNVTLEYRTPVKKSYIVYFITGLEHQKYAPDQNGNQWTFGVGGYKIF